MLKGDVYLLGCTYIHIDLNLVMCCPFSPQALTCRNFHLENETRMKRLRIPFCICPTGEQKGRKDTTPGSVPKSVRGGWLGVHTYNAAGTLMEFIVDEEFGSVAAPTTSGSKNNTSI